MPKKKFIRRSTGSAPNVSADGQTSKSEYRRHTSQTPLLSSPPILEASGPHASHGKPKFGTVYNHRPEHGGHWDPNAQLTLSPPLPTHGGNWDPNAQSSLSPPLPAHGGKWSPTQLSNRASVSDHAGNWNPYTSPRANFLSPDKQAPRLSQPHPAHGGNFNPDEFSKSLTGPSLSKKTLGDLHKPLPAAPLDHSPERQLQHQKEAQEISHDARSRRSKWIPESSRPDARSISASPGDVLNLDSYKPRSPSSSIMKTPSPMMSPKASEPLKLPRESKQRDFLRMKSMKTFPGTPGSLNGSTLPLDPPGLSTSLAITRHSSAPDAGHEVVSALAIHYLEPTPLYSDDDNTRVTLAAQPPLISRRSDSPDGVRDVAVAANPRSQSEPLIARTGHNAHQASPDLEMYPFPTQIYSQRDTIAAHDSLQQVHNGSFTSEAPEPSPPYASGPMQQADSTDSGASRWMTKFRKNRQKPKEQPKSEAVQSPDMSIIHTVEHVNSIDPIEILDAEKSLTAYQRPSAWRKGYVSMMKHSGNEGLRDLIDRQDLDPEKGYLSRTVNWEPKQEKGYANLFNRQTRLRVRHPFFIQQPQERIQDQTIYKHRDFLRRLFRHRRDDRYLSPFNGRVTKLVVQCSQDIWDTRQGTTTWKRTFLKNQNPYILRITNWVLTSIPLETDQKRKTSTGQKLSRVAKWSIACLVLGVVMAFPRQASGLPRNNGNYDPLPYKFWGYAKHARNFHEDAPSAKRDLSYLSTTQPLVERPSEPAYLCFLDAEGNMHIQTPAARRQQFGEDTPMDYVFVSYTSVHFPTKEDLLFVLEVGKHAARRAGTAAFWVGCSCLGEKVELHDNVYAISDVVRGANSMVVAVNDKTRQFSHGNAQRALIQEWADRVWTWPELLLSPPGKQITVYSTGPSFSEFRRYYKREFATIFEKDHLTNMMIDHYEGSLLLSRLELVSTALQCLRTRSTMVYSAGDMSYALMGLLRQRPIIDNTDDAFDAFARLSLANDSDLLLERLICVLPRVPNQPWPHMDDAWGVQLWDIYPRTKVCGIGQSSSVVLLDNVRGASIRWKSFAPVACLLQDSWRRLFVRILFRTSSYIFLIGMTLVFLGIFYYHHEEGLGLQALGGLLVLFSLSYLILGPYYVTILYGGKVWAAQPWLFGFEGYMDIKQIEAHIFGLYLGRLRWSAAGSPLCRHHENSLGECVGDDPVEVDDSVRARVRDAVHSNMGEEKIFTLVDTYSMTCTLFSAGRPPVAVLMCGEEGGMQRALLCSYEWTTQTLYRETVLRMETPVYDRMNSIGRVQLGLEKPQMGMGDDGMDWKDV